MSFHDSYFCFFYSALFFFAVHEKTLVHALEMMSLWCSKFTNEIPVSVIDGLKVTFLVILLSIYVIFFLECCYFNSLFCAFLAEGVGVENINCTGSHCLHPVHVILLLKQHCSSWIRCGSLAFKDD